MVDDVSVENKGPIEIHARRESIAKVIAAEMEEEAGQLERRMGGKKVICCKHREMGPGRLF